MKRPKDMTTEEIMALPEITLEECPQSTLHPAIQKDDAAMFRHLEHGNWALERLDDGWYRRKIDY